MNYKLGKHSPIHDRLSVPFGKFLTAIPVAPIVDIAPTLSYPMDGNDQVGCCVVAGFDHFNQIVTNCLLGIGTNFTQDQIWNFYKTQNPGFDPNGTSSTNGPGSSHDNGMNIQMFLEYLATNKYIVAFAKIDHTNEAEMRAAVYLGLSIMTGVLLDSVQMTQFDSGLWDYVPNSTSEGGHCIPLAGYPNTSKYTCVTWAKLVDMTEAFVNKQMDEAWFVLTQAHIDHPSFRNHFDLKAFSDAVYAITEGKVSIPVGDPILKIGSTGDAVKKLQTLLGIKVDGSFGPITKASVITFQTSHGLVPDGVVGPKTWAVLEQNPTTLSEPVTVRITRQPSDAKETIGFLTIDNNPFTCSTLELPWLNNQNDISCIPTGTYQAIWSYQNDMNAWHYELQNVPGRDGIFIHNGNYYKDTLGCILLGISPTDINNDGELDVTSSVNTLNQFHTLTNKQPLTIIIQ